MLLTLFVAIKNLLLGVFVGGFLMFLALKKDTQSFTTGTQSGLMTFVKFCFRIVLVTAVVFFLLWAAPKVLL